jgi:hypothetical protein
MERVNNTLRGRERNYRGLIVDDTPMIPPSKAAGIDLKLGHDKRNGLIKQAHKYKKTGGKIRIWEED